jgi:hypothetical protein
MTRMLPKTWTALHIAATGLATWLLCNTEALGGVPPLFFH